MNRPLAWVGAAFAAGIALGAQFSPVPLLFLASLAIFARLFVAGWSLSARDRALITCTFLIAGMVTGWIRARTTELDALALYARDTMPPGASWSLEGTVRAGLLYREAEYGRFVLDADTLNLAEGPRALSGGVSIRCALPQGPVFAGERVRVRGRADLTLSTVNLDIGGVEDYLRARGIHSGTTIKFHDIERLGVDHWRPAYWVERLRQAEADLLKRYIPRDSLPFVLAVWLGESATVGRDEFDAFVTSGTAHVLSVSGVHVAIIYMTLNSLLGAVVRQRRRRAALVIAGVFAYAFLAGAHVATIRSAVMFALYLGAELVDREPDAPTSLGLSAFVFLLLSPTYIFDAGFLLSFASVASMLVFNEHIITRLPLRLGAARAPLATSVSAQLLSFPLAAHYFHVVPIYGVLANFIVVPLLSCVLWLCLLTTIAGAAWAPLGVLFGEATHAGVILSRWLVAFFAELPGSYATISSPAWYAVPLFWCAAYFLARALAMEAHRWRAWAGCGTCALACIVAWPQWRAPAVIDLLDVGHGDAMLVRTPGGASMLIDGGDLSEYRDCGRSIVAPFLLANGIRYLDYVVCTHPDRDHIGGLFHIVRNFRVGTLLVNGAPSTAPLERALLALCAERGVAVRELRAGETVDISGAAVEVLHPPAGLPQSEKINNRSLVMRITWPGISVLCTGDIEQAAEERAIAAGDCRAVILKVPHHGSQTSSSERFLAAVQPQAAICSTETGPNRRAVHPEVFARYRALGIPLLRTDQMGGIRVWSDDKGLRFESARAARGYDLTPVETAGPSEDR